MLTLIFWAACVAGCYFLAKSQGRDTTIAAVLGLLFTVFALVGYLIAGDKNDFRKGGTCKGEGTILDVEREARAKYLASKNKKENNLL